MSVSVLPELRLREERLKATRRRGVQHVAGRLASKADRTFSVVRRAKSEQKLPEILHEPTDCATDEIRPTVEDKKERIRSIIAAIEAQKPCVAFSGHKPERRPGSGNSSLGSRSVSYHSLCMRSTAAVTVPKAKPTAMVVPTKKPASKKGTLNLKAPVLNLNAAAGKIVRKPLPAVRKCQPDVRKAAPLEGINGHDSVAKEGNHEPRPPTKMPNPVVRNITKKPSNKAPPRHPIPIPPEHKAGEVPKYLKKRQEQWDKEEKEEKERLEKLRLAPAGFSLMPEDERQETLESLKKKEEDLVRELVSLPVRIDTMRIQRRKLEIENQLGKIDEGIRMFSRPKVFIRHEAVN